MSDETLRPCPFCGGGAHTYKNSLWHVGCEHAHNGCVTMSAFVTEAEAIAAWNARADYHGYEQAAIEAWESIKAWNARAERGTLTAEQVREAWCGNLKRDCIYDPLTPDWQAIADELNARAERTCECVEEYAKSPIDGNTIVLYRCSKCNELMRQNMNYCPNCGRRVVSE